MVPDLQLAEDFLTAIVFVIVYLATDNLVAAVGIAIATGVGQFALLRFRGRGIVMQYLSIGLVSCATHSTATCRMDTAACGPCLPSAAGAGTDAIGG